MAEVNDKWDGCVTGRIRRPAGLPARPIWLGCRLINLPISDVWSNLTPQRFNRRRTIIWGRGSSIDALNDACSPPDEVECGPKLG
jgi:hypothetical protein